MPFWPCEQTTKQTSRQFFPRLFSTRKRINILWDATRGGYETSNDQDSDRFVRCCTLSCHIFDWRRHVIAEKTDCTEANLIEIAAYDYDDGRKPFQNIEILMKYFSRKWHDNK